MFVVLSKKFLNLTFRPDEFDSLVIVSVEEVEFCSKVIHQAHCFQVEIPTPKRVKKKSNVIEDFKYSLAFLSCRDMFQSKEQFSTVCKLVGHNSSPG